MIFIRPAGLSASALLSARFIRLVPYKQSCKPLSTPHIARKAAQLLAQA